MNKVLKIQGSLSHSNPENIRKKGEIKIGIIIIMIDEDNRIERDYIVEKYWTDNLQFEQKC